MFRRGSAWVLVCSAALWSCGKVETGPGAIDAPDTQTATLIVSASGSGGGTVSSSPAGINCGADCSEDFVVGTVVTLTAAPDGSSSFTGWSGGGCSGTGACTVTVNADTAVTANFSENNALDVSTAGTGTGVVISSPAGINCGSDCTEVYPSGTVVTLTAMADASSSFTGWSGACTGSGTCVVTVDQARAVTATFALNRYALSVTRSGSGSGSVRSSPAGIDCGADCTEEYDHGSSVTMTATPAVGSTFLGWSGGGCTGTVDCTVTMTAITTVTATFSINQVGLTAMKAGNGSGTVTSNPAGINCGTDCSELYNFGTVVTLTAVAASGSSFTGWSGGGCTGTGTCIVTVNAAIAVTATFTLSQFTLTVTRAGTGSGTVTSSPAGINCGADCSELYNSGTVVTLSAAPAAGSTFAGWSGACSGIGTCVVTMNAAVSVTATFNASPCTGTTTLNYTGATQTFTVPVCATSITVDAFGAEGGTSTGENGGQNVVGGRGARARGTFTVTGGQAISVVVGGRGANSNCGSGGGGGSYVNRSAGIMLIAGGGGGGFHCNALGTAIGAGGGVAGSNGGGGSCTMMPGFDRPPAAGGVNGNGGISAYGGGGGGFLSAGTGQNEPMNGGGMYPGSGGGLPGGGFGGGGGYYSSCCGGSGGGGGYSGGSGGMDDGCAGGGGGSINNGTAQTMTPGSRAGDGVVTITW